MATPTYRLIDSTILASSASSVTFSSITQDYRDLVLVVEATNTTAFLRFNGDTGSNYAYVQMYGTGSSVASNSNTISSIYIANDGGFGNIQIMDYSATDKHKALLIRRGTSTTFTMATANRWANTAAITSVTISGLTASFNSGSTFYLYGIEA